MSEHVLEIRDLHAQAGGKEVVRGVNLTVGSGEVHVIMGPNGSGKSTLAHALAGRPGVTVTKGSIRLDGVELVGAPSYERAKAGLFVALQQPIEVPGVSLVDLLGEAKAALSRDEIEKSVEREAALVGLGSAITARSVNVDLSGGEQKRSEILQLGVLRPPFCLLDEIDSGLDVDAVERVAKRIEAASNEWGLGVIAVTHFQRLLSELKADFVHVFVGGRFVESGGADLARQLETTGYGPYLNA